MSRRRSPCVVLFRIVCACRHSVLYDAKHGTAAIDAVFETGLQTFRISQMHGQCRTAPPYTAVVQTKRRYGDSLHSSELHFMLGSTRRSASQLILQLIFEVIRLYCSRRHSEQMSVPGDLSRVSMLMERHVISCQCLVIYSVARCCVVSIGIYFCHSQAELQHSNSITKHLF